MDIMQIKPGMLLDYRNATVEILDVDEDLNMALVRRQTDSAQFTASCDELNENPQAHGDGFHYY
ncbi:hypothetical protein [Aestuariibacter salexigens]|uniref:hypothetical protein n=1 Tax=Aestuariibacter salexigens TaxID=226010 RepID=UPI000419DEBC|nr:hypothetical protein [Aestuariibacter salexigens]